jgi:predicted dehydrogenase
MGKKVRWGILSTAGIAIRKAIPAMQKSDWVEVTAIASRDRRKAEEAASALGIPKAYGSYEELLADPEIEAIKNMAVIEAIVRSGQSGRWETPQLRGR